MTDSRQDRLRTAILVGGRSAQQQDLARALQAHAEDVQAIETTAAVLERIVPAAPELVVVLEDVPTSEAVAFVEKAAVCQPGTHVVVLARRPAVRLAVQFGRAGVGDYRSAPLDADALGEIVQAARQPVRGDERRRFFCDACAPGVAMAGRSEGIAQALSNLRRVARSRCRIILITGETGTGKELAARAVHAWRGGDEAHFVAVNCAALTANLLESELFGHVKGAFTSADRDKVGLLELAGSGTVFLDEISEMPLDLQAKLLRVLQERSFRRVGGTRALRCEATIIATSNRDLPAEVQAGRFRNDLYYRLAVFPVTLLPLRSARRREDVPLLAQYFLRNSAVCPRNDVKGLTAAAERKLLGHDWPGNVRELRNVIDRALILEETSWITVDSVVFGGAAERIEAPAAQPAPAPHDGKPSPEDFSLETAERQFILRALQETGWQRTRAAALLGITRATLHAKLKRYDIHPPDKPGPGKASPLIGRGQEELEGARA